MKFNKERFLTPEELLENYPLLRTQFNWNNSHIGTLLKLKVLDGYYDGSKRKAFIKESSVKALITHMNEILQRQLIPV